MNRRDVHKRLIASESYWFGGVRDVPKVFETGTRYSVEPILARGPAGHPPVDATEADCFEVSVDLATGRLSVSPSSCE